MPIEMPDLPPYIDPSASIAAAPQSPAYPLQAYAGMSPFAAAGSANFLNTPDRQVKLGQAYDQLLSKIATGPSPADRGEAIGRNIFGGLIAPAMAIFGGPGTSEAGVAMINQLRQDTKDARVRQIQEDNYTRQALKGIVDIANTTSLRPFSELIRDYRKGVDQDLKAQKQQNDKSYRDRIAGAREERNKIYGRQVDNAATLRKMGIELGYEKLNEAKRYHSMADERIRQIAGLNAYLRKRGQDAVNNRAMQRLTAEYEMFNAKAQQAIDEHNSKIDAAFAKGNQKTGKPFTDAKGVPLDPSQFHMSEGPLNGPEIPTEEPDDEDYATALNLVMTAPKPAAPSMMPGAAPQANPRPQNATTPLAVPENQMKSVFQQRIKAMGLTPDQGKAMFIQSAIKRGYSYEQAKQLADGF